MKTFWNDPDGISIKDVLGIILGLLFVGMSIFAIITSDPARVVTSLEIIKTISPLLLALVGGYAVTEGARGVISTYYQNKNTVYGDNEMNNNNNPPTGGQI